MKLADLKVGDRVHLTETVDNYPTIIVQAGETGTVTQVKNGDGDRYAWVRLDKHHDGLNEWNNELEIWDWENPEGLPLARTDAPAPKWTMSYAKALATVIDAATTWGENKESGFAERVVEDDDDETAGRKAYDGEGYEEDGIAVRDLWRAVETLQKAQKANEKVFND